MSVVLECEEEDYQIVDQLKKLYEMSQAKTPLGFFLAKEFFILINAYNEHSLNDYELTYPIKWDEILNICDWIKYIAVDSDGDIFAYDCDIEYVKHMEMWYIKDEIENYRIIKMKNFSGEWPNQDFETLCFKRP